jgi:NADPH-dependent curcumin reductase CurA
MVPPASYRKLMVTKRSHIFGVAVQIVEVPWQNPVTGEIIIRNLYSGVNASLGGFTGGFYPNAAQIPGAFYPNTDQLPHEIFSEATGEVVAVGPYITDLQPGDAVVTLGGVFSEYQLLQAARVIKVPKATPEISALVLSGLTASIALEQTGEMKSGETVLVTAAAGGTGQFAVQLARLAGNHVIGTCGSEEKTTLLKELGCDRVINYRTEDLGEVLKTEYPQGINLVYESVGRSTFDICLDNLAVHGRLIVIGSIADYTSPPEPANRPRINGSLIFKATSIRGFFLPLFGHLFPDHLSRLLGLYLEGKLKVKVDPTEFKGLESVIKAYDYLQSGNSTGKVVITY